MFRIKICGVTNVDDAFAAAAAGADAVGLNFYPDSPRHCSREAARAITQALPRHVCRVGVFVNATDVQVRETARDVGLDMVQLHGDEPIELLRSLRGLPVLRAFRMGTDLHAISEYLKRCHKMACLPRMVLLDASIPGQFGGTGATIDWQLLQANRPKLAGLPLVLAGGLKASNVAEAIAAVRPWAVDTASGVESSPGKKSHDLIQQFVATAKAAFAS